MTTIFNIGNLSIEISKSVSAQKVIEIKNVCFEYPMTPSLLTSIVLVQLYVIIVYIIYHVP